MVTANCIQNQEKYSKSGNIFPYAMTFMRIAIAVDINAGFHLNTFLRQTAYSIFSRLMVIYSSPYVQFVTVCYDCLKNPYFQPIPLPLSVQRAETSSLEP